MIKTALQIKTIGYILKEKRKEKMLELKQVSDIIRIRIDYLQALEDGDYTKFPSEVYLKGFLKNYAKFLGINTEKALALYRRENEKKQGDSTINSVNKIKPKNFIITFTPNRVIALIAAIAMLVIIIYLGSYVGRVLKTPDLKLTSPIPLDVETSGVYKTDASSIELVGSVEIGSKFTINDQELKLNNFERFNKDIPLEEGQNTIVLKAESQFGKSKTLTLTVQKEAAVVPITPTPTPTPVTMDISIEIQKKDANINASVDGEKRTDRQYKVGATLQFIATKTFSITTNQPASLVLKINGEQQTLTSSTATWEVSGETIIKK